MISETAVLVSSMSDCARWTCVSVTEMLMSDLALISRVCPHMSVYKRYEKNCIDCLVKMQHELKNYSRQLKQATHLFIYLELVPGVTLEYHKHVHGCCNLLRLLISLTYMEGMTCKKNVFFCRQRSVYVSIY